MISQEKLFGNFFDVDGITPMRLLNFGLDAVNRFKKNDTSNLFEPEIQKIAQANNVLQKELADVSGGLAMQKAATFTVDGVMARFKETMKDENLDIAYRLGGPKAAPYIEFYPQGKEEYSSVTKTQMPVLTARVADMASKHAALLGPALAQTLKDFAPQWDGARNDQQGQKGAVGEDRAERSGSVLTLELALVAAIHAVGRAFPGDVEKGKAYFDFRLLDASKHPSQDRP